MANRYAPSEELWQLAERAAGQIGIEIAWVEHTPMAFSGRPTQVQLILRTPRGEQRFDVDTGFAGAAQDLCWRIALEQAGILNFGDNPA